jgi:HEPN domain-containing protein
MTNIPKQTEYWLKSAKEDFDVGRHLIKAEKMRHGLFFLHLALEKMLKACFCKKQGKTPPKIHNLPRLAELAKISFDQKKQDGLEAINRFCIEGRYPDEQPVIPGKTEVKRYIKIAEEISKWLEQQL